MYTIHMMWDKKILKMLGLSDVSIELLRSMSTAKSLSHVAKETGIPRTSVAFTLKELLERKLVNQVKFGKRYRYIALTQQQFVLELQNIIDEVTIATETKKGARIKTAKENEFIIHVGPKEIIPTFARIASLNKNERIKAIQHHRSYLDQIHKLTPEQFRSFNKSIIDNHLVVDGILNEGAYDSYEKEITSDPQRYKESTKTLEGRMADYTVFPNDRFNYDSEIWIFKDTTLIINWHEDVAIEIINKNMTGFMREMFEYVKAGGKKVDHNKMIREVLKGINA